MKLKEGTVKVRATWLDLWDHYRKSEMTEEELHTALTGERTPTLFQTRGTAFHRLLESTIIGVQPLQSGNPYFVSYDADEVVHGLGESGLRIPDGFTFIFSESIDVDLPVAGALTECEISRTFYSDGGPVHLVGHVDAWLPQQNRVWDWKTTGQPDLERYCDSWQWRTYLTLSGAHRFTYGIFHLIRMEEAPEIDLPPKYKHDLVKDFYAFDCYRYRDMDAQVQAKAREVADYCRANGIGLE